MKKKFKKRKRLLKETLPCLQPAEIQWMYICQKCLVGCIFDSKMEFAVINTSYSVIFTSTSFFHCTGKKTSKIVKNKGNKYTKNLKDK